MSDNLTTCSNCGDEVKRSTSIVGKASEFPDLVEKDEYEENDEITLCYDCYSKFNQ